MIYNVQIFTQNDEEQVSLGVRRESSLMLKQFISSGLVVRPTRRAGVSELLLDVFLRQSAPAGAMLMFLTS